MTEKKENPKENRTLTNLQLIQNFFLFAGIMCLLIPMLIPLLWPMMILIIPFLFLGLICFDTVKESRAITVERLGAFRKGLMSSKDKKFDEYWNIIPISQTANPPNTGIIDLILDAFAIKYLGGLRFVGWRWIDKTRKEFHLRRRSFEITKDGKRKIISHDEMSTDGLYLQWDIYPIIVEKAETKEKERFATTITLAVSMAVHNLYVAVYVGDPNWPENVETVLSGIIRSWTAQKTIEEVLSQKGKQGLLSDILTAEGGGGPNSKAYDTIQSKWGIEVDKDGLQIIDVELPPDEEEAIAKAKKEQYKSLGLAQQTSGALIAIRSDATGKTIEQVRAEFNGDSKKLAEHEKNSKELLLQRISAESGSLLHIKTEGSPGIGGADAGIIAAFGKLLNRPMPDVGKKTVRVIKGKPDQEGEDEKNTKKPSKENEKEKLRQKGLEFLEKK